MLRLGAIPDQDEQGNLKAVRFVKIGQAFGRRSLRAHAVAGERESTDRTSHPHLFPGAEGLPTGMAYLRITCLEIEKARKGGRRQALSAGVRRPSTGAFETSRRRTRSSGGSPGTGTRTGRVLAVRSRLTHGEAPRRLGDLRLLPRIGATRDMGQAAAVGLWRQSHDRREAPGGKLSDLRRSGRGRPPRPGSWRSMPPRPLWQWTEDSRVKAVAVATVSAEPRHTPGCARAVTKQGSTRAVLYAIAPDSNGRISAPSALTAARST